MDRVRSLFKRSQTSEESTDSIRSGPQDKTGEDTGQYPTGSRLALIFLSLLLSTYLVALDGTIIATAIPTITAQFNSLSDVSWYNASFLLTTSAFQVPYARAYTLLSTKWVFLSSIFIFEVGSAICGSAPTSVALIIGRAISGVGAAGIFGGSFNIIAKTVPLRKRSAFLPLIGAVFAVASSTGPILGGAFTTHVSWRWCFYINLPIGAIVFPVVALTLPNSTDVHSEYTTATDQSWWKLLQRFDPAGTLLFITWIICLELALQWGGLQYPWSDDRVITILVVFGVLFLVWLGVQYREGDNATISFDVISQRSVAGSTLYTFFGCASFTIVVYYMPLWFQAIKQEDAVQSGIHNLPLVLGLVVFAASAGLAVTKLGYYVPFLYLGTVLSSIGAGILTLLTPTSGPGKWITFQALFGAGVGASLEQCTTAIQASVPPSKIPSGTGLVLVSRSLAGSLALSIVQNIFIKRLERDLSSLLPGVDISGIVNSGSGATDLVSKVEKLMGGNQTTVRAVLDMYNGAVTQVLVVAVIFACLSGLGAVLVEWKDVRKEGKEGKDTGDEEEGTEEQADVEER